jgi:hypothetical protein
LVVPHSASTLQIVRLPQQRLRYPAALVLVGLVLFAATGAPLGLVLVGAGVLRGAFEWLRRKRHAPD